MGVSDPEELARLFAERASASDLEGLMALYEDGAALVGPDGQAACGSASLRERLQDLLALEPQITPAGGRSVVAGDVALISSSWQMTLRSGEQRAGFSGTSTEVARRQPEGGWRYVIDDPSSAGAVSRVEPTSVGSPDRFEQLHYELDGAVARLTLARPERHNALSMRLSAELTRALELVRASRTIKVLVIQGAGETFCAGDDITEMPRWGDANAVVRRVRSYQRMADLLEELDKVTVAAVDGYAVGGGLEITLACDFVVATERARWGMPEVDSGITPGWGGTTRLTRLVGRRMSKEINLIGALHPARRAVELGLWNRTVADGELASEVARLCQVLCSKNQQALRQLKLIIDKGAEGELHTAQGFELLSAGLSAAVNGAWEIDDCDRGQGILHFAAKGGLWSSRRALSRDFWSS